MITPSTIINMIIIGLASGTIYGIMALSFVLLYRVARIVNIAVGDMILLGAYLVLLFANLKLVSDPVINILLATILAAVLSVFIAVATERGLFKPLYGQSVLTLLMMTVALGLILRGCTIVFWGTTLRVYPGQSQIWPLVNIKLGPINLPYVYTWVITGSLAIFLCFLYIFRKTIFGIAMRAVSLDPEAAAAHGISLSKMYTYSWIIAYIATVFSGLVLGAINGINIIISALGLSRALPAALIGGIDSPGGALLGGVLLGVIENTIGTYLNLFIPGLRDVIPYLVLLGVLIVKPYGFFGTVRIERV